MLEALKARNAEVSFERKLMLKPPTSFRAFSAQKIFNCSHLGRWPRLSHVAPLALRLSVSHSFDKVGTGVVTQRRLV